MSSNESSPNYDSREEHDRNENSSSNNGDREIAKVLTEVGQSLEELRNRYLQVKQDWQRRAELVKYKQELQQKKANNLEREPIKTELRDLEQQISELEINLESVLLPDLFWQAVRFSGLGIVIGWVLKSLAS
ncbi:MAG: hypothetical protein QNJ55_15980 [Xenococcus sp. MO_188.B8]|nr:hypothetical protein [Xenococcus sp. MO_188.B8]